MYRAQTGRLVRSPGTSSIETNVMTRRHFGAGVSLDADKDLARRNMCNAGETDTRLAMRKGKVMISISGCDKNDTTPCSGSGEIRCRSCGWLGQCDDVLTYHPSLKGCHVYGCPECGEIECFEQLPSNNQAQGQLPAKEDA